MATWKKINGKLTYVGPTQVTSPPLPKTLQERLNEQPDLEEGQAIIDAAAKFAPEARSTLVKTARTAAQALVWSLSVTLPVSIGTVHDWSTAKAAAISVGVSAANAVGTAVVTLLHNTLEDRGIIRSRKG